MTIGDFIEMIKETLKELKDLWDDEIFEDL
jgi:hypothetical protein